MSCGGSMTTTETQECFNSDGSKTVTVIKTVICNGQKTVTKTTTTSGGRGNCGQQYTPVAATKPAATPSPNIGNGTSSPSSTFEAAVLAEHNRLRVKHSAAPFTLNSEISRYAQEWANNLAARNSMFHRTNGKYGENLYASFGKANVSGEEAVQAWYNEIKDYTFGQPSPGNFGKVGHFTQVVWKSSRELGVGIARNGNNIYVVCNYDPPGNFMGQYAGNVSRN